MAYTLSKIPSMGEYERQSMENREKLRKMALLLFKDDKEELKKHATKINEDKEKKRQEAAKRRAEKKEIMTAMREQPRRSTRLSVTNNGDENHGTLVVSIGRRPRIIDWSTYADEVDEDVCARKKRRSTKCLPPVGLKPEDVTESHIASIALTVSEKMYDPTNGTTCHQCRQKTADMKTVCRSKSCSGVRGQFCGICLKNRYGEDAAVALKDPDWSCPPCRGLCNCSICRTRDGKGPTGQLYAIARAKGFSSVLEYLKERNQL